MNDVVKAIDHAECALNRTMNESLQMALGRIGKLIGTNQIEVSPPRMYVGERKDLCVAAFQNCDISRTFQIKVPFSQTYEEIRDYLDERLKGSRDDTPIESIVDTYQYQAELAKQAGCFMPGSAAQYELVYSEDLDKARQWRLGTGGAF